MNWGWGTVEMRVITGPASTIDRASALGVVCCGLHPGPRHNINNVTSGNLAWCSADQQFCCGFIASITTLLPTSNVLSSEDVFLYRLACVRD